MIELAELRRQADDPDEAERLYWEVSSRAADAVNAAVNSRAGGGSLWTPVEVGGNSSKSMLSKG
ncbi:hypothetical protein GCM10010307_79760 [Streptomyces vastus]|uniref:Uncharacterized protein n=1 Tax=Streptomyces vastus TaxID=285451 RepID=A0ABN3RV06_9ACTN